MQYKYLSIPVLIFVLVILTSVLLLNRQKQSSPYQDTKEQDTKAILLPQPTLNSIFSDDHRWIATLSAERIRIVTATGDIIPARSVNYQVIKYNNPVWPYEKVVDILNSKKTDIMFIDLETPLLKNCPLTNEGMVFCGDTKNIAGLTAIRTTIANMANNHAGNHGIEGVLETKALLESANITPVGIDGPVYKDIRGVRFAFLGYNDISNPQPGIANVEDTTIKRDIALANNHADIVIVTYHWGIEYRSQPDEDQKRLGHLAIDAGADVVIGNHPHWIQPIEFYKGKLITYAHGNFIFDQMWSQKTKEGVIGRYIFLDTQLIDVEYLPLHIQDYGQAAFLEGEKAKVILENMKKQSHILAEENT